MIKIKKSEIVFLDFQYCHGNDKSIFMKELAFMGGTSVIPNYFVFKKPFDKSELTQSGRRKNRYCQKFINGLDWSMGSLDYCSVRDILMPLNKYKYIFVVGKVKKDFLLKYVKSTVINLENKIRLSHLNSYFTACPIHVDNRFKCALNNVYKLFMYVETNSYQLDDFYMNKINF